MRTFTKILCRTTGIAGMSLALYDAYSNGQAKSRKIQQQVVADHFEKVHSSSRTLTNVSPVNSAMQGKIADLRQNNPIIPVYGKVKGFLKGALSSLGDNIFPIAFSALAIAAKGAMAKVGAIGAVVCGLFNVLKEGFGIGKTTPMD